MMLTFLLPLPRVFVLTFGSSSRAFAIHPMSPLPFALLLDLPFYGLFSQYLNPLLSTKQTSSSSPLGPLW